MSKKTKKAAQMRRAGLKRSRKEAMQKQYQTWAAAGQNKKSKRNRLNTKRKGGLTTKRHGDGVCNNQHGCSRCGFPELNDPFQASPGSCLYGKRWSSKKWRKKD